MAKDLVSIQIQGREKLALIGKAVRRLGADRTVIKNLTKRIKLLAKPVIAELRVSAATTLPRRHGLSTYVAKAPASASVRRGADSAGISIRMGRNTGRGARAELQKMDEGTVRHPLHGNRKHWYGQKVNAGFATKVKDGAGTEQFVRAADAAMDDTIAELLHGHQ